MQHGSARPLRMGCELLPLDRSLHSHWTGGWENQEGRRQRTLQCRSYWVSFWTVRPRRLKPHSNIRVLFLRGLRSKYGGEGRRGSEKGRDRILGNVLIRASNEVGELGGARSEGIRNRRREFCDHVAWALCMMLRQKLHLEAVRDSQQIDCFCAWQTAGRELAWAGSRVQIGPDVQSINRPCDIFPQLARVRGPITSLLVATGSFHPLLYTCEDFPTTRLLRHGRNRHPRKDKRNRVRIPQ